MVLPHSAVAASPTSRPSDKISTLFTKLADRDPAVREQARIDLMGLSRSDLPAVRKYVKEHRPLAPAQLAPLRDIVTQIYLAGERYPANVNHGFLGVQLSEGGVGGLRPEPPDPSAPAVIGVIVSDRLPGLCAFRMLANGDVIVGVAENPESPIRNVDNLKALISEARAGDTIHLEVFRGGRVVTVPVALSARPLEVENLPPDQNFFNREKQRRLDSADEYWQREFAPLIDDGIS